MICGACRQEVDPKRDCRMYDIPFYCSSCHQIKFICDAVRDVVFIYPIGVPDKFPGSTLIEIPEYVKKDYDTGVGIVLSVGPGFTTSKGNLNETILEVGDKVVYNAEVPWSYEELGTDGNMHTVVYCGVKDVWLRLEEGD